MFARLFANNNTLKFLGNIFQGIISMKFSLKCDTIIQKGFIIKIVITKFLDSFFIVVLIVIFHGGYFNSLKASHLYFIIYNHCKNENIERNTCCMYGRDV